ncbi:MAG TPA: hypothetical protein VFS46_08600 [Nitrososphaera sp.]|nr:hypothetical protein [Nitrososphaera sp.]
MQDQGISTYHVTMDDDKLGVKPEALVGMYTAIDAKARQMAPQDVRRELIISQDGRIKTRFYIQVSNRMAPHLIAAIQQQAESESGIGMKSYFYKLQEQVMSQMFAGVKDVIG